MGQGVLLFVPGFKGSRLVDVRSGRPVWVTAREALFGRRSLAIASPELGIENPLELGAGGPLEAVTVLPGGLLRQDVYGSAICALAGALPSGWTLSTFAYDWRRPADELARDLDAHASRLLASGVREIRLFAHSMGAMLSGYWLQHGAGVASREAVTRAVFVAGAFQGTAKMFRVLQVGDPVARNRTLLSATALGSFPSSYFFLPDVWPYVVDAAGNPLADDPTTVPVWRDRGWGLLREPGAAVVAREAFLAEYFQRGRRFLRALQAADAVVPAGLQALNLVGVARQTLNRVVLLDDGRLVLNARQRDAVPGLRGVSLGASGDGTIARHAAELPPALRARQVGPTREFPAEHMAIVQPGPALHAARNFLFG